MASIGALATRRAQAMQRLAEIAETDKVPSGIIAKHRPEDALLAECEFLELLAEIFEGIFRRLGDLECDLPVEKGKAA